MHNGGLIESQVPLLSFFFWRRIFWDTVCECRRSNGFWHSIFLVDHSFSPFFLLKSQSKSYTAVRIIRENVVPQTLGEWVPTGSVPVEEETQLCLWGFECWRSHSKAQVKWARIKRLVSNAPLTLLLTHTSTLLYGFIEGETRKEKRLEWIFRFLSILLETHHIRKCIRYGPQ